MSKGYDGIIKEYEDAIAKMAELIELYRPLALKKSSNIKVYTARRKVKEFRKIKRDMEDSLKMLRWHADKGVSDHEIKSVFIRENQYQED